MYYHNLARYLFITLAFAGLLSTGWFGIPLIPQYFVSNQVNVLSGIFALFSALGTIWGVMAYREFTKSIELAIDARDAARRLDPMIGEYEFRSYNPVTREYESGFVPSGPIDFWDKAMQVPTWMDKGKYWHILLSIQVRSKEIRLKVVKDKDLPFQDGSRNVAVTTRERSNRDQTNGWHSTYVVKVPQWLVMNTERKRFTDQSVSGNEVPLLVADLNKKIVSASDEVADWEKQRIKYPWHWMTLGLYLNKSLPLRIVYRQVIRRFPGARKRNIEETNANLANVKDDELIASLLELASEKEVPQERIEMVQLLMRFLKNEYARLGLGEGASEYHSFHHSLEVSYMAIHMIPKEFQQFAFGPKDYELVLLAALLHDYDPAQPLASQNGPKGPSVARTMQEISRTRILDAYFTMTREELSNYFREFHSPLSPPQEFATTHPEYIKKESSPVESVIAEMLIWRTDFPFFRQKTAQEMFAHLRDTLGSKGENTAKVETLAEILWLADLAVTYMGSDPIRAWDRVTNLYEELNLPKLEAVRLTDAFFADFAENRIFKQVISMKHFPYIFRQRWNVIYQFFHEGNPSTQINRTIATAGKQYLRVNLEIGMKSGEMLQSIATENWGEYFIGIGKDQTEVFKAKSRFAILDPQNASAFWGDTEKLIPAISDGSIDNFLMVLPESSGLIATPDGRSSLKSMFAILPRKLTPEGSLRILTDLEGPSLEALIEMANQTGMQKVVSKNKKYFQKDWRDPEFKVGIEPQVVVFVSE
jgi:hypothetical protein